MHLSPTRRTSPYAELIAEDFCSDGERSSTDDHIEQYTHRESKTMRHSSPSRASSYTRCTVTAPSIALNIILMTAMIYLLSSPTSVSLSLSSDGSVVSEKIQSSSLRSSSTDKSDEKNKITHISLLGERNSGTTWTHAHLQDCFGDALPVRNRLTRHKHWFQDDTAALRQAVSRTENEAESFAKKGKTLVIAQFRDPIYWVDAMRRKPHHSPMHYGFSKSQWKDFVETPWTLSARPERDQAHVDHFTRNYNATHAIFHPPCHEGFLPHQMMTCLRSPWAVINQEEADENGDLHGEINNTAFEEYFEKHQPLRKKAPKFSGYQPRYEHHPITGEPYKTLLELRRDKIYNFVQHVATWDWTSDEVRVERYENLVANGTTSLIKYVEQQTGLTAKCDPYPPQPNRTVHNPFNSDSDEVAFLEFMHEHLDWEAEALIGYYPMN
jgi:hypothetical protein